jgi:hypothetical protein
VPPLPAELAAIVALCTEPISVAEIGPLGVHLGVTRILVMTCGRPASSTSILRRHFAPSSKAVQ